MIKMLGKLVAMVAGGMAVLGMLLIACLLSGCSALKNCEIRLKPGARIENTYLEDCVILRADGVGAKMKHVTLYWTGKAGDVPFKAGEPSKEEVDHWISELKRLGIVK